jgi:hypothetical protein
MRWENAKAWPSTDDEHSKSTKSMAAMAHPTRTLSLAIAWRQLATRAHLVLGTLLLSGLTAGLATAAAAAAPPVRPPVTDVPEVSVASWTAPVVTATPATPAASAVAAIAAPAAVPTATSTLAGAGMRFEHVSTLTDDVEPVPLRHETDGGRFQYAIDASDLRWADDCGCFRYYVIYVRSAATGAISKHKFRGTPIGPFSDQHVTVTMTIEESVDDLAKMWSSRADGEAVTRAAEHVQDARTSDTAAIELPVSSRPGLGEPLITTELEQNDGLSLFSTSRLTLTVRNTSSRMPVRILSDVIAEPASRTLWQTPPSIAGSSLPTDLGPEPDSRRTITLTLRPRLWRAIETSFMPSDRAQAHSWVQVQIPYLSSAFPGSVHVAPLSVPVRFRPGLPLLLMVLAAGVAAGSVVPALTTRRRSQQWMHAAGLAFVVALAIEVCSLFILRLGGGATVALFRFTLDPQQMLPVLVLGLVSGLIAFALADLLKTLAR